MRKFEYKLFETTEYPKADYDRTAFLNKLGAEGWRVVSYSQEAVNESLLGAGIKTTAIGEREYENTAKKTA